MYTTCKRINVVLKMISEPTITEEKENWLKLFGRLKIRTMVFDRQKNC